MESREPRDAATLSEMLRRRTALTPDAQYFTLFDETVTYRRLWEQRGRYAAGLAKSGVRTGDKVCLIYPTCAEFFYTFFGCLRLGEGRKRDSIPEIRFHKFGEFAFQFFG